MKGIIIRYKAKTAAGAVSVHMRIFSVADREAAEFCSRRGERFREAMSLIRASEAEKGRQFLENEMVIID